MKKLSFLILIGFLFSSVVALGQEIYRWVDEKGTVHFADDLSQIPARYLDQVQKKKIPQETPPPPSPGPGTSKAIPRAMPRGTVPEGQPVERKDILGRGEDWWRGQVREWGERFRAAQKDYQSAMADLKNKQNEIEEAKFKPDSLKRKLKAEMKQHEDRVNESKKRMDDARNMLERGLPRQAQEYHADPNWLQ